MTHFDSKSDFLKFHQPESQMLMQNRESRWLLVSLNYALAQMAQKNLDAAQMSGARAFIDTLMNLAEPVAEKTSFPKRELNVLDQPTAHK